MNLSKLKEVLLSNHLLLNNPVVSELNINAIHYDSRKVSKGDVFLCIRGENTDGHLYINKAIEQGAIAIITENEEVKDSPIPVFNTKDTKKCMGLIASEFFNHPTSKMNIIGVTGTNGKTTTTQLIEQVLLQNKINCGLIGTIETRFNGEKENSTLTTPLALDLQELFARMNDEEVSHVAMEVSSHALSLGRVDYVKYKTAIFTNLTQDHLDYHKTMEEYKKAKGLLFSGTNEREKPDYVVLNADDKFYEYFKSITTSKLLTYSINNSSDVQATDIHLTNKGTVFTVSYNEEMVKFETPLIGLFNVYNMLAAISGCLLEGLTLTDIRNAFTTIHTAEGRMELVNVGQPYMVVVDYAHTPDGLEKVLSTLKQFVEGEVRVVFGCGGNRDREKRPIMGKIASDYADKVIVTSDNPRNENPESIIADVLSGVNNPNAEFYIDRQQAIEYALQGLSDSDCLLIAGKGHEKTQKIQDKLIPFDDKEVVKKLILNK